MRDWDLAIHWGGTLKSKNWIVTGAGGIRINQHGSGSAGGKSSSTVCC